MKKLTIVVLSMLMISNIMAISIESPVTPNKIELVAVQELKKYLPLTIEELTVNGKKIETIHASSTGQNDESWKIRQEGNIIKITGGNSRGLLYGVYNFLENVANIRFWSPVEEFIPAKSKITLDTVDADGKYFFKMRDMYRANYPKDGGKMQFDVDFLAMGIVVLSQSLAELLTMVPPTLAIPLNVTSLQQYTLKLTRNSLVW